ncbi:hypothetical protein HDU96_007431 [Phlyctochytrium bullatum]|nr:hypothetical protein HDU96_007431 [Phlyctochytrium bullatum]
MATSQCVLVYWDSLLLSNGFTAFTTVEYCSDYCRARLSSDGRPSTYMGPVTLVIAGGAVGGLLVLTFAIAVAVFLYRASRPSSAKQPQGPQLTESSAPAGGHSGGSGGAAHLDARNTPAPPRGGGGNGGHMSQNPDRRRGEDAAGQAMHRPEGNTSLPPGAGGTGVSGAPSAQGPWANVGIQSPSEASGAGPTGHTIGSWSSAASMFPSNPTGPLQPFLHASGPASFASGPVGAASGGTLAQPTPSSVVSPQHDRPDQSVVARGEPMPPDSERARQEAYQAYYYTGMQGTYPATYYAYHPVAPGMQVAAHHPNAYAGGPSQQAYVVTQPQTTGGLAHAQQPQPATFFAYSQPKSLPPLPDDPKHDFSASARSAASPSTSRPEARKRDFSDAPSPLHHASTGPTSWMHPYEEAPGQHTVWKLADVPHSSGSDISAASNVSPVLESAASTSTSLGSDAAWPSQGSAPARIAPARMSSLVNRAPEVTGEMAWPERKG